MSEYVTEEEIEGFLCPECIVKFTSSDQLVSHFNGTHANVCVLNESSREHQLPTSPSSSQLVKEYGKLMFDYSVKTTDLESQVKNLSSEASFLKDVINAILSGSLTDLDMSKLNPQLHAKIKQFISQQERLHKMDQQTSSMIEVNSLPNEVKLLTEKNTVLIDQFPTLALDFEKWKLSTELTKAENVETFTKISELSDHLSRSANQLHQNDLSKVDLNSELERLSEHAESLQEIINSKNDQIQALQVEVDELRNVQLPAERRQVDDFKTKFEALESTNEFLSKNAAVLMSDMAEFKKTAEANKTAAMQKLSEQLVNIETKYETLNNTHASFVLEHEKAMSQQQIVIGSNLLEHQTLMDQFISTQDKNKQLERALDLCHTELENLQRIVLELGRQNQTLQIAQERISSRQWVNDETVLLCANCQRNFSLSVRRHHCRSCGGVFCQSCSLKKAPTPASRTPLRVCDSCFFQLTGDR